MIPTGRLTTPCLPMPPLILPYSRCTSMVVSAIPLSSALSQTGWVSSGISLFTTKTFSNPILKSSLKRNPPPRTWDKSLTDSKALVPTLRDFFQKHPLINPMTFLGDAAFDSIRIYKYLLHETSFVKAYIPLKNKLKIKGIHFTVNADGIPCCPHDVSLPMKREGACPIYAAGSRP